MAALSIFQPAGIVEKFQEGNAVQYTFFVPHDPQLMRSGGSRPLQPLSRFDFTEARKSIFSGGKTLNAFSDFQAHTITETSSSLHISVLFNFRQAPPDPEMDPSHLATSSTGSPASMDTVMARMRTRGQLGAWYVMSAIGLFDVKG